MRTWTWLIRHADGGAQGTPFARARLEATDTIVLHAAPDRIHVEVFENGESLVAAGEDLRAEEATPMCRLTLDGDRVLREQIWPQDGDLGSIVLLPGGEAGRLESWRADPDHARWTWTLRFDGGR